MLHTSLLDFPGAISTTSCNLEKDMADKGPNKCKSVICVKYIIERDVSCWTKTWKRWIIK
jgi:hypothetical protein